MKRIEKMTEEQKADFDKEVVHFVNENFIFVLANFRKINPSDFLAYYLISHETSRTEDDDYSLSYEQKQRFLEIADTLLKYGTVAGVGESTFGDELV